jgi:hypothetical protein
MKIIRSEHALLEESIVSCSNCRMRYITHRTANGFSFEPYRTGFDCVGLAGRHISMLMCFLTLNRENWHRSDASIAARSTKRVGGRQSVRRPDTLN